mmetsp:Transcript_11812/g.35563  ORF Transcript_11812/g.35563 Transcript_11812/m.35563 type:complete len:714 (-) Transcript_11812:281-2422(-)
MWVGGAGYLNLIALPPNDGQTRPHHSATSSLAEAVVAARNKIQHEMVESTRLGIPVSFIMETLHSGANDGTIFPMPINFGSSWNLTAMEMAARVIANEARAIGADRGFSPVVNMFPDPRYGRLQEGYSEDPKLTKLFGLAHLTGLQQSSGGPTTYLSNPDGALVATVKHYAAYGLTSGGIDGSPADVSEQRLREMYLAPWEFLASRGLRSVMAAQNAVNGRPMHANKRLLTRVLRDEWRIPECLVESDGGDVIGALQYGFHVAATIEDAAIMSLEAGMDVDLGGTTFLTLTSAVRTNRTTEAQVDRAVRNVLTMKFASGLFESPYTDESRVKNLDTVSGRTLARQIAEESLVLLKNRNGTLPLLLTHRKIALVGPLAHDADSTVGGYVNPGAKVVTVRDAFDSAGVDYTYHYGASPTNTSTYDDAAVMAAMAAADTIVLVLGDTAATCGEMFDRSSLDVPGGQLKLIEAASKSRTPVVVVLINGRSATFGPGNTLLDAVDSLVVAWRPGEEGGTAIWNVLSGVVNPSGHLTQAWPRSSGAIWGPGSPYLYPYQGNHQGEAYAVDGPSDALFNFGYGLSYTNFCLTHFSATPSIVTIGDNVTVRVTVNNVGSRTGATVVQVYFRDPVSRVVRIGSYQLLTFGKTEELVPGATADVTMEVPVTELAYWDDGQNDNGLMPGWHVDSGTYQLYAGFAGFGSWAQPLGIEATITVHDL